MWVDSAFCSTCKFFGAADGTCRREPPDVQVYPSAVRGYNIRTEWPTTTPTTPRCGSYELDGLEVPTSQVELPLVAGGVISVNPGYVMAVTPLTASTTRVTVAGINNVSIALSYAATLAALTGA